jgi:cell division protein FtsB
VVKDNMDIKINGDEGPSIRFRIGLMAIVQVIATFITFGVALRVLSADVDRLKTQNETLQREMVIIRETQAKILAVIEDLRDDIRYQRERIDRKVEGR